MMIVAIALVAGSTLSPTSVNKTVGPVLEHPWHDAVPRLSRV